MSVSVYLDGFDITDALNSQYSLPPTLNNGGIYPDNTKNNYWDLLKVIKNNQELYNYFMNEDLALHKLQFVDSAGTEFSIRPFISMKYNSRNR